MFQFRATKILKVMKLFSFSLLLYECYISDTAFSFLVFMFSQCDVLKCKKEEEEKRERGGELIDLSSLTLPNFRKQAKFLDYIQIYLIKCFI
jgi:hypothetical protein